MFQGGARSAVLIDQLCRLISIVSFSPFFFWKESGGEVHSVRRASTAVSDFIDKSGSYCCSTTGGVEVNKETRAKRQ